MSSRTHQEQLPNKVTLGRNQVCLWLSLSLSLRQDFSGLPWLPWNLDGAGLKLRDLPGIKGVSPSTWSWSCLFSKAGGNRGPTILLWGVYVHVHTGSLEEVRGAACAQSCLRQSLENKASCRNGSNPPLSHHPDLPWLPHKDLPVSASCMLGQKA